MTETKFTPGPWLFHAHNGEITDSSPAENRIADVQLEDWHKLGAGYANASLIAAAPEIYALLEIAACPCCDGSGAYCDGYGEVCQCQWCDERTKVIAKARGES